MTRIVGQPPWAIMSATEVGFNNPAYSADDYSLSEGSSGAGFVVFVPWPRSQVESGYQASNRARDFRTKFLPASGVELGLHTPVIRAFAFNLRRWPVTFPSMEVSVNWDRV